MRVLFCLLTALLMSVCVQAATFCVAAGDVAGLNAALAAAATNAESDTIQLQAGRYDFFAPIEHYSTEPYDLSVEGGYQDFFGNPCGLAPQVASAAQTVLDGNSLASISFFPDGGSIAVRNLTIQNAVNSNQPFAAVQIISAFNVIIENSIFRSNLAYDNAAISIGGDHIVQIKNSLAVSNVSLYPAAHAIQITNSDSASGSICNLIVNSTFSANLAQSGGLIVANGNQGCVTLFANSILWGNGGPNDLSWYQNDPMYLINDDIGTYNLAPESASGTINIDPLFKDQVNGDYSLQDVSLLHNRGSSGGIIWAPGQWDVTGNPRVDGIYPDIGAYELQDVIFANGFDQDGIP